MSRANRANEGELLDPSNILLAIIYSLALAALLLCFYVMYLHHVRSGASVNEGATGGQGFENQTGVIYELLTLKRKQEIDILRKSLLQRILDNFSQTLHQDDMIQRCGLEVLSNEDTDSEYIERDTEEGGAQERTHITIPRPGVDINGRLFDGTRTSARRKINDEKRVVTIFCAICLSEYNTDDEICWSNNSSCPHVYHKECLLQWLVSLGRKKSSLVRFSDPTSEKMLVDYSMVCPSCRQEFITEKYVKEKVK